MNPDIPDTKIHTHTYIHTQTQTLSYEIWQSHIDKQKLNLITNISSSNYLENTTENLQFISIIKGLVNCNLFNVSNIAFSLLKLLENTYIDSNILCESISINKRELNNNNNTYLDTLKKYLNLIIYNVVYIELSININLIIIINYLQKLNKSKDKTKDKTNITTIPKAFHIFEKINNDATNNIKPSSLILLFLKLIRKLGKFHMNSLENNSSNIIKTNTIYKNNTYTKHTKETSNNLKYALDKFIVNINNFYESKDYKDMILECPLDTSLNITQSLIKNICQNHIAFIVKILFNEINTLFDILIIHLKTSKTITEEKKLNLEEIKDNISNMISNDIEKIKNKLLFEK